MVWEFLRYCIYEEAFRIKTKDEKNVVTDTEAEGAIDETPSPRIADLMDKAASAALAGSDKTIEVKDLPVNTRLQYSLYDIDGNLLLNHDNIITEGIVSGLLRRGITTVIMKYQGPPTAPAIHQEANTLKDKPDREFYKALDDGKSPANISRKMRETALNSLGEVFIILAENESFDIYELQDNCEAIIDEIVGKDIVRPSIIDLYLTDASIGHHSINVIVTFAYICSALKLPKSRVREYAAASVLHDVGKVILEKVARSDEKKELVKGKAIKKKLASMVKEKGLDIDKLHAEVAYIYLRNMGGIEEDGLNVVRNHHERIDGKGYPRGIKGKEFAELDQVLALADYYENITWNPSNEIKTGQYEAVKTIIQQSGKMADCRIISAFLNVFGHFPPGSWVALSSGEIGLVIQATPFKPRSPLVHVYFDKDGNRLDEAIPLNLSEPSMPYIVKHVSL